MFAEAVQQPPVDALEDDLVVFNVMFYSPRIAANTGNAIRLVAGTGGGLQLVQPLGFDLSEPKLRRAGLDYHAVSYTHLTLPTILHV